MNHTSRTHESALGAGVGNALVAALGAAADLSSAAVGALEEGVAVAEEPLPAGGAYFIVSHVRSIRLLI